MDTDLLKQLLEKRATIECDLMNFVKIQKDLASGVYINPICELTFEKSKIILTGKENIFDSDGFIKPQFLDPDKASGKAIETNQTYGRGNRSGKSWSIMEEFMKNSYGLPGFMGIDFGTSGKKIQQSERFSIGQFPINETLSAKIINVAIEHITQMLYDLDGMIAKWYEDNGQDYSKNSVVAKVFNKNNRDEKI